MNTLSGHIHTPSPVSLQVFSQAVSHHKVWMEQGLLEPHTRHPWTPGTDRHLPWEGGQMLGKEGRATHSGSVRMGIKTLSVCSPLLLQWVYYLCF